MQCNAIQYNTYTMQHTALLSLHVQRSAALHHCCSWDGGHVKNNSSNDQIKSNQNSVFLLFLYKKEGTNDMATYVL